MGVEVNSIEIPKFDQLDIIKEGTATIIISSSPTNWATVAHNLGFTPQVIAFLNHVDVGGIFTDGDMPLPTWTSLTVDSTEGVVEFKTWLQATVDSTNLYILGFNSTGVAGGSFDVKYYLLGKRSR